LFPVSIEKIAQLSKKSLEDFQKYFQKYRDDLVEVKHYLEDGERVSFTKSGLLRFGFLIGDDELVDILETLEKRSERVDGVQHIYKTLEEVLVDLADRLSDQDVEKVAQFVDIFEKFLKTKEAIFYSGADREELPPQKSDSFLKSLSNFASGTRDVAYKFATKTEDDAYRFASDMGKDAYHFTSDTRDKAHDFVMKTEDDAYKFASNMGKDAFNFASKGMDYGYRFASRGMQYGYEFASKGEEVGEMANRVLWMASEIGIMADRIGEMSDRIVHTEHLIIHTAMLIQNFGLLIDGTIKHMSESILKSLSMLLNQEFEPLKTTDKHLEIISEITKEIIKNNHEYDMAVLEKQSELRKVTISALDKIEKGY
jgi:hypothetical protein